MFDLTDGNATFEFLAAAGVTPAAAILGLLVGAAALMLLWRRATASAQSSADARPARTAGPPRRAPLGAPDGAAAHWRRAA